VQILPEPLFMALFYTTTAGTLSQLPSDGLVNVLWAVAAVESARLANVEAAEAAGAAGEQQRGAGGGGGPGAAPRPEQPGPAANGGPAGEPADAQALQAMVRERVSAAAAAAAAAAGAAGAAGAAVPRSSAAARAAGQSAGEGQGQGRGQGQGGDATAEEQLAEQQAMLQRLRAAEGQFKGTFRPVQLWQDDLLAEILGQMEACPDEFDKVAVVKLVRALGQLRLPPAQPWAQALLRIAEGHLRAGLLEPLELVYVTRSCALLLDCQRPGEEAPGEVAALMAAAADALGRVRRLPPEWASINVRCAPYAVPRGGEGEGAEAVRA
jgi:DNA-binding FrmR family transcriptional regulator